MALLSGLYAVRDRVKNLQPVSDFFTANYNGAAVRHFVGYKKLGNIAFLPAICYVPTKGKIATDEENEIVSIVIQLLNKVEENEEQQGVLHINQAADLILDDLLNNRKLADKVLVDIDSNIEIINELVETFPYFQIELSVPIIKRVSFYGRNN